MATTKDTKGTQGNAIDYVMHCSRSFDAVIGIYDTVGNVIETVEQTGEFCEP